MSFLQLSLDDRRRLLATLEGPGDPMPRKRRRLDNLSPDERVLRRKLKNRVAAQVARDRKKARMEELEELVVQLEEENIMLKRSNAELNSRINKLSNENNELRIRGGLTPPRTPLQTPPRTPPSSPVDHGYAATCPSVSKSQVSTDSTIKKCDIVIKREEYFDENVDDDDEVFTSDNVGTPGSFGEVSTATWSSNTTISSTLNHEINSAIDFNTDNVKVKVEIISDDESDCYDSYFANINEEDISENTKPGQNYLNPLLLDSLNSTFTSSKEPAFIKVESSCYGDVNACLVKMDTCQPNVVKVERSGTSGSNSARSSCSSFFVNEKPFQSNSFYCNGDKNTITRRKSNNHDEVLLPEEQLNKIAAKLQPTFDDIWEDPFVDIFPPLMAV